MTTSPLLRAYRSRKFTSTKSELAALNALLDSGELFTAEDRRPLNRRWRVLYDRLLFPSARLQVLGAKRGRLPKELQSEVSLRSKVNGMKKILDALYVHR